GPWLGNWTEGGTETSDCGAVSETTDLGGVVVISAGTKSGTIRTSADGCVLTWDVSGDSATLESGQSCMLSVFGTNATVAWTAGSATFFGYVINGTLDGSPDNGCSAFSQKLALRKM